MIFHYKIHRACIMNSFIIADEEQFLCKSSGRGQRRGEGQKNIPFARTQHYVIPSGKDSVRPSKSTVVGRFRID